MRHKLREMEATIDKLKAEATDRERVLADRDKRFVVMRDHTTK